MLLRLKKIRWSSPNIIITTITIITIITITITITITTIITTIIIITTTITIIIITREMMPEAAPFLSEEDLPAFAAANPLLWFGFSWRLALSLRKPRF
ncbi:MAG TPA: hypothetical protein VGO05_09535 [Roseiarcus sp.]|nr:hypothetical protein [Roseiarcus sp.]